MYLSRFGVKNYKCLADVDIPLTPIHVLIGQNDSGKSSLMEAIAGFHASGESKLEYCFPMPWGEAELVRHGQREPEVEIEGHWRASDAERDALDSEVSYGFTIAFGSNGRACTVVREWIRDRGDVDGDDRTLQALDAAVASLRPPPSMTALYAWKHDKLGRDSLEHWVRDRLSAMKDVLKLAQAYALNAKLMAIPATSDLDRKFRLDPDGFGLATLLADIALYDPERYQAIRARFCELFPQFKSVRVESESAIHREYQSGGVYTSKVGVGSGVYFEMQGGQTVRAQQASDGAVLFLGFLALAHIPDPPTLLLIEEPENGIYPKRLAEVIRLLKELVEGTDGIRFPQIIFTTHSPYVLSFFNPEEVTFLSRDPKNPSAGVRARPLREAPNIRERLGDGEFYLGELWYNLTEEELFGES